MASKIRKFAKGVINNLPIISSLKTNGKAADAAMNEIRKSAGTSTDLSGADVWETMYKTGVNNFMTRRALKKELKNKGYTIDSLTIDDKANDGWKKVKSDKVWKGFGGLEIYKGDSAWDTFKRNTRIGGEVRAAVSATALAGFGASIYYALGAAAGGADAVNNNNNYSRGYGIGLGTLGLVSSIASGSLDGAVRSAALMGASTSFIQRHEKAAYLLGLGLTASTLGASAGAFSYQPENPTLPSANISHYFSHLGSDAKETGHDAISFVSQGYHSLEDSVKGVASDVYTHIRHPFSGHDAAGHGAGHGNSPDHPSGHGRTPAHSDNHNQTPSNSNPNAGHNQDQNAAITSGNNNLSDYCNSHPHRIWANYGTTGVHSTDLVERSLGAQGDHFTILNLDHAMKDINSGENLPHGVHQPYHGLNPQDVVLRITEKDGQVFILNLDDNGRSADLPQFVHNGRIDEHVRYAELCYNDNHGTPGKVNDDTLYVFATAGGHSHHGHNSHGHSGHAHDHRDYKFEDSRGHNPQDIAKFKGYDQTGPGEIVPPSDNRSDPLTPYESINTTLRVRSSPWDTNQRDGTLDYRAMAATEGVRPEDMVGIVYTGHSVAVNPHGNHSHTSTVNDHQGNQEHLNGTWSNIWRPDDQHIYRAGEWKPGMPLQAGLTHGADDFHGNQRVIFSYEHEQGYAPSGQHTNAHAGAVAEAYVNSNQANVHTSNNQYSINTTWDNGDNTHRGIEVNGNESRSGNIGRAEGFALGVGLGSIIPRPPVSDSGAYSGMKGGQIVNPPYNGGQ
jgi:hypothetical protein